MFPHYAQVGDFMDMELLVLDGQKWHYVAIGSSVMKCGVQA